MASPYSNVLWGSRSSGSEDRDPYAAEDYREQLKDPDSYASQVVSIPRRLVEMQTAVNLGNITKAKGIYDDVTRFFAEHSDDVARGMALDSSGDRFLQSIQQGSFMARDRAFDAAEVTVRGQKLTAGDLFGPGGSYQSMMDTELRQMSGFSQEVSEAMSAGDEVSKLLDTVVSPMTSFAWRTGQPAPGASAYNELAHHIATHRQDVDDLGFDAINAITSRILDKHMKDGTATAFYRDAVKMLRARADAAPDGMLADGAGDAYRLMNSLDSMMKTAAGDKTGEVAGSASRAIAAQVGALVAADPGVDFNDPDTVRAIADLTGTLAYFDRAGLRVLPMLSNQGVPLADAMRGFLTASRIGVNPPEGNMFTRLAGGHALMSDLLTPGWEVSRDGKKGDPTHGVLTADGTLGRASGLSGLDEATSAMFGAFAPFWVKRLVDEDEVSAIRAALADPDARAAASVMLSRVMAVPRPAARIVVDRFADSAFTPDGIKNPVGLERLVGSLVMSSESYTPGGIKHPEDVAMLRDWYSRNVGETGALYDRLLQESRWEDHLLDPLLGYGELYRDKQSRAAFVMRMKQDAKRQLNAAMRNDSGSKTSVRATLRGLLDKGKYYSVVGYIDPNDPERKVNYDLDSLDPEALIEYEPVIRAVFGDLKLAKQPFHNWRYPGTGRPLPVIDPYLWTVNEDEFRLKQAELRELAMAQQAQTAERIKKAKPESDGI